MSELFAYKDILVQWLTFERFAKIFLVNSIFVL